MDVQLYAMLKHRIMHWGLVSYVFVPECISLAVSCLGRWVLVARRLRAVEWIDGHLERHNFNQHRQLRFLAGSSLWHDTMLCFQRAEVKGSRIAAISLRLEQFQLPEGRKFITQQRLGAEPKPLHQEGQKNWLQRSTHPPF